MSEQAVSDDDPRFTVQLVSVGEAGLTARPAVWDRVAQKTVYIYLANERHLAEKIAEKLNRDNV